MNLKEIRKAKGLTQKEVSEILNIPLRTIKRYEADNNKIGSFKYEQICNKLLKTPVKTGEKRNKKLNIAVVGAGYVGLSLASLLSIYNDVTILDINEERIDLINQRNCYLNDQLLEKIFTDKKFSLKAMSVKNYDYSKTHIVIVATNTDFDSATGQFNMSSVVSTIQNVREKSKSCLIVIKSTVPMGFTKTLNDPNVIFSPEFLREGNAIKDNLFPSRIIIGVDNLTSRVKDFANCLINLSVSNKNVIYMTSMEAEAVKLFSNAYLAMRVAYFNELDSYAETNDLNARNIIKGVSLDPRIGEFYNNPSFGYGGYCLPKDTAQLENSFLSISNNNIIRAIVESNQTRKHYIVNRIIEIVKDKNKTIGFYKVSMKKGSDNYRSSSSLDIANQLIELGYKVIIYDNNYKDINSVNSFSELVERADLIVANRKAKELIPYAYKVYTRDQFEEN